MFLACITLDLMDKERSRMSPEDCSLSHTKRAFEEPFKRVSSHTLCWALGVVPWIVQVSCSGVGLIKHLSVYLFINQVYSEPLLCAVNILSGGECFRLNTPEIDSKTENCELCTKGLLGDILGRYSERRWRKQDWVGMERSRLQLRPTPVLPGALELRQPFRGIPKKQGGQAFVCPCNPVIGGLKSLRRVLTTWTKQGFFVA